MNDGMVKVRATRDLLPGWCGHCAAQNFDVDLVHASGCALDNTDSLLFLTGGEYVYLIREKGIAVFRLFATIATRTLTSKGPARPVVIYDYEFEGWRALPPIGVATEIPAL
jgi:hypothetical protein